MWPPDVGPIVWENHNPNSSKNQYILTFNIPGKDILLQKNSTTAEVKVRTNTVRKKSGNKELTNLTYLSSARTGLCPHRRWGTRQMLPTSHQQSGKQMVQERVDECKKNCTQNEKHEKWKPELN